MAIQDLLQRLGQRASTGLERMGATTDPRLSPEAQRLAGIQNLSRALRRTGATLSGDPQRMALQAQEDEALRQRKLAEDQKRRLNQFLASSEGAKYRGMGELLGTQSLPLIAQDVFKGKSQRKIVKGADGFNYYEDTGERVFPSVKQIKPSLERFTLYDRNTGKAARTILKSEAENIDKDNFIIGPLADPFADAPVDDDIETWAITDKDGNRVRDLVNPTKKEIQSVIKQGYFINKTPQLTSAGKAKDVGEIKGWNDKDGLEKRAISYNTLVNTGQRIINNLYNNPKSVLATGDIAQVFDQMTEEFKAIGEIFSAEERNTFINTSPEGQDNARIKNNFAELAKETAITESQLLDFAYQIAKVRGQEGRGLSDQDFRNFQKIISAGRTAEQKAAALYGFITGIGVEVTSELDYTRSLKNLTIGRNPQDREANAILIGINDLYTVGFGKLNNPFLQQQAPTETSDGKKTVRIKL